VTVAEHVLAAARSAPADRRPTTWLVSPGWDLAVFGGPALASFLLLAWGNATGALDRAVPAWTWVATVLAVDVAHVWATAFRVYLDPVELRRRPGLYAGVPLAAYTAGVLLYSASPALFWRVLAYAAVLHFVRQQYGWVALYRRREGDPARLDRILDDAAIYSATLYPLLHWHANLPREFEWFVAGDFVPGLPRGAADALLPLHLGITAAWLLRQGQRRLGGRPVSAGKLLVMATTWLAWYGGIVALDSDYAFTVTNVLVHGVPYIALVWTYGRRRWAASREPIARVFRPRALPVYLAPLLALAWLEEWGWDRLVWHERAALFPGPELSPGPELLALIVPLLALPQATHYLLDAWIWRVKGNPDLGRYLGFARSPAPGPAEPGPPRT
jgi:hypothetical protein